MPQIPGLNQNKETSFKKAAVEFEKLQSMVRKEISKQEEDWRKYGSKYDVRNLPQISGVRDGAMESSLLKNNSMLKQSKNTSEVGVLEAALSSYPHQTKRSGASFNRGGGFKEPPSPNQGTAKMRDTAMVLDALSRTANRFQALSPSQLYVQAQQSIMQGQTIKNSSLSLFNKRSVSL